MEKKFVTYAEFGAKGDGKTDDMAAIAAAHAYANEHNLPVVAEDDATYYIGEKNITATIRTNTDWGKAHFILDDRKLEHRGQTIFMVPSAYEKFPVSLDSLSLGQKKVPLTFEHDVLLTVRDENTKIYRRKGVNASSGVTKNDTILVDKEGNVLNGISWEFDKITEAFAREIDDEPLTINGGFFTTIANEAECFYNYHDRNIHITRSRVTIQNLTHRVTGEGDQGAPYGGFILANGVAYLTLRDCSLSGHKLYWTPGQGGMSPMGTYDINLGSCSEVSLIRVTQVPDIMDSSRWGLMGSNFCKGIHLEDCAISRFDAHMGVHDCDIKGSSFGWQCVQVIGHGTFDVKDSSVFGRCFISLRYDYGCHFDGNMSIKNSKWLPKGQHPVVIGCANEEDHDFGYICKMPKNIVIENLLIDDTNCPEAEEICLLSDYKPDPDSPRTFPYIAPEKIIVKNVKRVSGQPILVCKDRRLYPNTIIEWDGKII